MLTVVTAAHNNLAGLQALHGQLSPFLGSDLRWVVKDSGACVATQAWARDLNEPWVRVDASEDRGLYDALNRALAMVDTEFYLVAGSDDALDGPALRRVVDGLQGGGAAFDVLAFPVRTVRGMRRLKRGWPTFLGMSGLVASHSVGTIIRKSLHERFGLYDTRYRILADSCFLRKAHDGGAVFAWRNEPSLGIFGLDGVSSSDHGRRIAETYSYLVECGSSPVSQAFLMMLRLVRYRSRSLL